MTDPYEYGIHPSAVVQFYNFCGNVACLTFILLLFAWAELLVEDNLKVSSSGWLNVYKWHFIGICLWRLLSEGALAALSAANVNDSYRIVHRVWLLDWSWLLAVVVISSTVLTTKLLKIVRERGKSSEAAQKVRFPSSTIGQPTPN
jgi:hypothetical protein